MYIVDIRVGKKTIFWLDEILIFLSRGGPSRYN